MNCPACRHIIPGTVKFCAYCGQRILADPTTSAGRAGTVLTRRNGLIVASALAIIIFASLTAMLRGGGDETSAPVLPTPEVVVVTAVPPTPEVVVVTSAPKVIVEIIVATPTPPAVANTTPTLIPTLTPTPTRLPTPTPTLIPTPTPTDPACRLASRPRLSFRHRRRLASRPRLPRRRPFPLLGACMRVKFREAIRTRSMSQGAGDRLVVPLWIRPGVTRKVRPELKCTCMRDSVRRHYGSTGTTTY